MFLRMLSIFGLFLVCSPLLAAEKPRLVVVVSVDQLGYQLLEKMEGKYEPGGLLEKVTRQGAWFTKCLHNHSVTYTAPGHAVMLTGVYTAQHGIVGNNWYDRAAGGDVYCVDCKQHEIVGGGGKGKSPLTLTAPTVGDFLKEATDGKAKVFGVSIKDRSGMLMAGKKADGVFWFENRWVTSTYYMEKLPPYLEKYNREKQHQKWGGKKWELLHGQDRYQIRRPDDYPYEQDRYGLGRAFPHPLPSAGNGDYAAALPYTPYGNDLTLEIAKLIVSQEKLGEDDIPDLLAVSLSSNDYIGHNYGPYSLEVQDVTLRTDLQLAEFAAWIDKQLNGGPWVLALTSDHGVCPIPEYAVSIGLPAARDPLGSLHKVQQALEQHLAKECGPPPGKEYVEHFAENQVFFPLALREDESRFAKVLDSACTFLESHPAVHSAFHRHQILAKTGDPLVQHSFHPKLSGDIMFSLKPYMIQGSLPATHGSRWEYDRHVPLLLLGSGIRPGRYEEEVAPAALAPTLCELLGLTGHKFAEPALEMALEK